MSAPALGRALDVGTSKIVAGGWEGRRLPILRRARNAFLDLKAGALTRRMLSRLKIPAVERAGRLWVVGDEAFALANVLERDTRRPMDGGLPSAREPEALPIVRALVRRLLRPAVEPGQWCTYAVPADPIDREGDVLYQTGAVEMMVRELGYAPQPVRAGLAVVFSELEAEAMTGVGICCGGGMFNICLAYKGVEALSFSTARGGDWIDRSAAQALGTTPAEVCAVKEAGIDLLEPTGRVAEAVALYARHLVRYTLEALGRKFEAREILPAFGRPVPLVLAGGTARAGGFLELFRRELAEARLPLEVSEVRLSRRPLNAVAFGCLKVGLTLSRERERAA
jgi:hypothetical protein